MHLRLGLFLLTSFIYTERGFQFYLHCSSWEWNRLFVYSFCSCVSLPWIYLCFAFVFMKSCLALSFLLRLGVGWNFCVCCCNKLFWSTYHKSPILFFIYILHHTLLVYEACVMFDVSVSALTGLTEHSVGQETEIEADL